MIPRKHLSLSDNKITRKLQTPARALPCALPRFCLGSSWAPCRWLLLLGRVGAAFIERRLSLMILFIKLFDWVCTWGIMNTCNIPKSSFFSLPSPLYIYNSIWSHFSCNSHFFRRLCIFITYLTLSRYNYITISC
jgi:hypothetical protein